MPTSCVSPAPESSGPAGSPAARARCGQHIKPWGATGVRARGRRSRGSGRRCGAGWILRRLGAPRPAVSRISGSACSARSALCLARRILSLPDPFQQLLGHVTDSVAAQPAVELADVRRRVLRELSRTGAGPLGQAQRRGDGRAAADAWDGIAIRVRRAAATPAPSRRLRAELPPARDRPRGPARAPPAAGSETSRPAGRPGAAAPEQGVLFAAERCGNDRRREGRGRDPER